ncbi:MAG TPA: 50S ribosomal protein L5 [Phycisphaerales bacterium]|nr:50S ribosomal protein L5 [Phycisphaerales bacterium]|tara:strand:- start:1503 stop:2084 length:582 start_codon:yes stop_codon:yes gene_type:complete
MVTQATTRLKTKYVDEVAPKLREKFNLRNVNQQPSLEKIIVNVGVGKVLENQKLKPDVRDTVISTLTTITGQKPVMILAKKSVANFKVREGAPSAFMVTIRRERMWGFLDRLINFATPRIKDFRGLSRKSFDQGGNYGMGLTEQAVWPEIDMGRVSFIHGMNINFVIANSDPAKSLFLLEELGMPFTNENSNR